MSKTPFYTAVSKDPTPLNCFLGSLHRPTREVYVAARLWAYRERRRIARELSR